MRLAFDEYSVEKLQSIVKIDKKNLVGHKEKLKETLCSPREMEITKWKWQVGIFRPLKFIGDVNRNSLSLAENVNKI